MTQGNIGHIFMVNFFPFPFVDIFCEIVALNKVGLKFKKIHLNYSQWIGFGGILMKLQKYPFLTFIEVNYREKIMTVKWNTSVRRYGQNLGSTFPRFFIFRFIREKMKQMHYWFECFFIIYKSPIFFALKPRFVAK